VAQGTPCDQGRKARDGKEQTQTSAPRASPIEGSAKDRSRLLDLALRRVHPSISSCIAPDDIRLLLAESVGEECSEQTMIFHPLHEQCSCEPRHLALSWWCAAQQSEGRGQDQVAPLCAPSIPWNQACVGDTEVA
jgi:hypothetical protein